MGSRLGNLAADARFNRAICLLERGEVLAAQSVFEQFAGRPASSALDSGIHALWLGLALFRRGDLPAALDWADRGLQRLEGMSDPEVRLPLLLLRGEVLLLTGQRGKAARLLAELESAVGAGAEADDALHACALRALADRRHEGPDLPFEARAREILPLASPEVRSLWHLARAHLRPQLGGELWKRALDEARAVQGPTPFAGSWRRWPRRARCPPSGKRRGCGSGAISSTTGSRGAPATSSPS